MAVSHVRPYRGDRCVHACEAPVVFLELTRALDTKLARTLRGAFKSGDHAVLVNTSIDPNSYSNADVFWRDWQAVNMMSKYPKLNLGINTTQVALDSFHTGEEQCRLANKVLTRPYDTPTLGISGESLIESARLKIRSLLPDFCWDDIEPWMTFSGGATTRLRRTNGDAYHKFQGKPEVTREAALLACVAIERVPAWVKRVRYDYGLDPSNWVTVVSGSRITTVPKNAKTDRVIAVEPDMNMFLQKGFGGFIRQRLKRVGIDLDDQTINQRLARDGSADGSLSTIDLKAASDTISIEIVRRLLPSDWFEAMDLVRSRVGTLPSGKVVAFQKFSSMGNGFTFELESLIFWALSASVVDLMAGTDRRLAVYGDDIIVPTAAAGPLVELLQYVGFTTNVEKSFFSGPFRESCGKHYFNGIDVTPFYIRDEVCSTTRLFWLANSIRRWAARPFDGAIADPRFIRVWERVVNAIPVRSRVFIPEGIGDCGLVGTFMECRPKLRRSMWSFPVLQSGIGRKTIVTDEYAYVRALMHGGVGTSLTDLLVDRSKKWQRWTTFETSQWLDGPLWPSLGRRASDSVP